MIVGLLLFTSIGAGQTFQTSKPSNTLCYMCEEGLILWAVLVALQASVEKRDVSVTSEICVFSFTLHCDID